LTTRTKNFTNKKIVQSI